MNNKQELINDDVLVAYVDCGVLPPHLKKEKLEQYTADYLPELEKTGKRVIIFPDDIKLERMSLNKNDIVIATMKDTLLPPKKLEEYSSVLRDNLSRFFPDNKVLVKGNPLTLETTTEVELVCTGERNQYVIDIGDLDPGVFQEYIEKFMQEKRNK